LKYLLGAVVAVVADILVGMLLAAVAVRHTA
jgi:hypothetical protein